MKARVNKDVCIGCGLCPQSCPEVFVLNSDGIAVVRVATVPSELEGSCRQAAAECPVEAIILEE